MLPVNSTADVFKLMKIGQQNRAIGATALNEHSSRSHSVLTVHVRGMELATGAVLHGCLHLVDLAGSERVDRSEATGDRLKEAQHINKSLSALGDVVSALAQKSGHVPYRNSKLTQLLQDSLGGQAKTLMFVHISPDLESYGETLSTLKFAERVASVELGAARTNKESRELRDLKEQVALLKELVSKKDIEIEHLQAGKVSNERISGSEKMKVRVAGNASAFRRQTMDVTGQKEKRLVGRLFLDSAQQQDAKTAVVSIESANTKEPQDGGGKEDARMGTSKNMVKDTDGGIRPWRQKGGPDHQAEELEAVSEEWRHIIRQSQVHPYIPGGANNQQAAPDSVISFPNMRSVMENETYLQAMSLRETISAASQSEAAEES